MTEIGLSVAFSHIDGTSVKQLLHMLKDVEEEFYENKKINHEIEWQQEGIVFLYPADFIPESFRALDTEKTLKFLV